MVSLRPPPSLGRYVPTAIFFAIGTYASLLAVLLLSPPADGGGGGQVLGHLNVSLGGAGAAGVPDQVPMDSVVQASEVPPVPPVQPARRTEPRADPIVETVPSKPRVVEVTPVAPQSAETPRVREHEEPATSARARRGEQGDGNRVGAANAGAPKLGEGAISQVAGLGSADALAGDQRDAYLALIRQRIEQNRTYPSAARRNREEGMATLRITIDGQGRVSWTEVLAGSGSFHLDRTAKRMIEKAAPFPAPPVAPFTAQIPIVFALH